MKKHESAKLLRKLQKSVAEKNNERLYIPTSAERKLLLAMTDENNRTLTVADLCAVAGVDRQTYYNALKRPGFAALVREFTVGLFLGSAAQVAASVIKQATRGEFKQQELVLKQAGIIRDNPGVSVGNLTLAWGGKEVSPIKTVEQG